MTGHAVKGHPWQLDFIALAAAWGCSFWFIKVGLRALSPVEVATSRPVIGLVALLVLGAVTRTPLPRGIAVWRHLFVVGILLVSVPFTLFSYAETHVSSVLAGLINAATPLVALVVVMAALPSEAPTRSRIVGVGLGFAGILIDVGVWRGFGGGELRGVLACCGAVICYGISFPYNRRFLSGTGEPPTALATGQVLCGAAQLVPFAVAFGRPPSHVTPQVVLALLALGAVGTGIAYVLNFRIIAAAGPTTASTVTYVVPLVAVVVGVTFLGEHLTWNEPVGGLVVLTGVAVSQGTLRRARTVRLA
jgi:drug/metabolite transporter (DMT)-like permease